MCVTGRAVDKIASYVVYAGFSIFALWAGIKLVNHSLDTKFYKDFVVPWDLAVCTYNRQGGLWPEFSGGNHVEYMDRLAQWMQERGSPPPSSNTERAYVYRLKRLGHPKEHIFLLSFSHRMVLYGISEKTFTKMDTWIDGRVNDKKGLFIGRLSKDGVTRIGELQL
ncbi:MAG: hypothetical protein JRF37_03665 [Deltaproteobacteria bacterium]|nr:hypothetical protein [Deltaproteobacteria bacterium]MBW2317941.1 hypothetical protein [Deltaproteobacteria bacterium]